MKKLLFVVLFAAFIISFIIPAFAQAQIFSRNLFFGLSQDQDVVKLQDFLRARGFFDYPISTGNYFTLTLQAVKKFQQTYNIFPQVGYFGPKSRAVANSLVTSENISFYTYPPTTAYGSPLSAPGTVFTSPHKGKIFISYASGYSDDPKYETITLENRTENEKINVTGLVLESSRGGRFVIPKGHELPRILGDTGQDFIILKPRERVIITAGRQSENMDFRTNICIGYLTELSDFTPAIYGYCPRPDTIDFLSLSDRCLDIIDSTPYCRKVDPGLSLDSNCSQFVNQHLSYAGCVNDFRSRPDFFGSEWYVWMQRGEKFLRSTHDAVILKDQQEREVDRYVY